MDALKLPLKECIDARFSFLKKQCNLRQINLQQPIKYLLRNLIEEDMDESELEQIPSFVLISGSEVVSGNGKFIAIVVGDDSILGQNELQQREKLA